MKLAEAPYQKENAYLPCIELFKHCQQLTIYSTNGETVSKNIAIPLSFTHLQQLTLHGLTLAALPSMAGLTPNLLALSLFNCSIRAVEGLLEFIIHQHSLQSLTIQVISSKAS